MPVVAEAEASVREIVGTNRIRPSAKSASHVTPRHWARLCSNISPANNLGPKTKHDAMLSKELSTAGDAAKCHLARVEVVKLSD